MDVMWPAKLRPQPLPGPIVTHDGTGNREASRDAAERLARNRLATPLAYRRSSRLPGRLVLDATRHTVCCPRAIGVAGRCGVDIVAAVGARGGQRDEVYLCRGDGGRGRGVGVVVAAVAVAFLLAGCGRRRGSRRRRGWKASNHMNITRPGLL